MSKQSVPELPVEITVVNRPGASVALKQIDLTGVEAVTFAAVAPARHKAKGGKIEVRLDSPTGALLGETELIRPTTDSTAPPARLRTSLQPTSGIHDVYLVFRNPDAKGDGFLFGLLTATFENARRSAGAAYRSR
ncbi:MAG TPA: carbohydrate-binding protein [Gemmatimonadaceae bacterium]|nr:carbohydrate-binding protein [Gemmatimonadaceae bacterium]